ncbi:carbohydrate ABC transporter permease [Lapillicoccus jejuensis]|uniref:carbohydrate ABC transporter permease n=1 Tax=Lapillicoccus jejuensis TaxID=402171 RepID=UPI0011526AAC|nr:sugar ABC transporter permease [Lapillicoccus jejuensis]
MASTTAPGTVAGPRAGRRGRSRSPRPSGVSGAALYRRWWTPLVWVAPTVVVIAIFGVFPFVNTVVLSFTDAKPLGGGGQFVGLENYRTLLSDPSFWQATRNSFLYAAIAVPLLVVLPLVLAVLVQDKIPFIGVFRSAFYAPVIASVVAVGLIWQNLFAEQGPINTVLQRLHVVSSPIPFLSDSTLILLCAVALTVWKGLGWYMIFYMAALGSVPKELYDAAKVDGAGAVRRFLVVTVPGVRLTMLLVGLMSGIGSLRVFTEIYVLGGPTGGPGGGAQTLPFYIQRAALDPISGNAGYGAAISVALFLMTGVLALVSQRLGSDREDS